jgi:hypothetical protein
MYNGVVQTAVNSKVVGLALGANVIITHFVTFLHKFRRKKCDLLEKAMLFFYFTIVREQLDF